MAYLLVCTARSDRHRIKLEPNTSVTIGRALGSELWLDDPKLSRQHCRIELRDDDVWELADLDSTNGTFVHGKQITTHELIDGDVIEIGTRRIVFRDGEYVPDRPSDPVEAATMPAASRLIAQRPAPRRSQPDPSESTIAGRPLPRVPKLALGVHAAVAFEATKFPAPASAPVQVPARAAAPLPFARPPARPIVERRSRRDVPGSRWVRSLLSRLHRH
jgi:hypothetical protein